MKRIIAGLLTVIFTAALAGSSVSAQDPKPDRPPIPPLTEPNKPTPKPQDSIPFPIQPPKGPEYDRAELRLEVFVAKHVIGLVNAKTEDEKARDEAKKLLNANILAQINKTLNEWLGSGNEFERADRFDELLKEIDRSFERAKEQDVRAWLLDIGRPINKKAPWPVCLISGC